MGHSARITKALVYNDAVNTTASTDENGQTRVWVFNGEPLARLWEDRLRQEGVPSVVKPMGLGATYGSPMSMPYGLYVRNGDASRVLEMLRAEGGDESAGEEMAVSQPRRPISLGSLLALIVVGLVVAIILFAQLPGRLGSP